ncbi:DNA repair protein XRCC4-like [Glandiceps talaboti]
MTRKTLCKLTASGDEYYLLTTLYEEGDDGFNLVLSNGTAAWTGEITLDELESMAEAIKMDPSDYITQTCKALTREVTGRITFQYQIKKYKGDSIELSWKKVMDTDRIKFQLGSVVLEKSTNTAETVREIIEFSIEKMGDLKKTISTLESNNERLSAERRSALKRLEKCVDLKSEVESDLYGKFQVLVNEKKAKIRQLKEDVTEARRIGISQPSSSRQTVDQRESDTDKEIGDGDTSELDTTDEEEQMPLAKGRKKLIAPRVVETDDLVLGDGDEMDSARPTKRRRVRQPTQKKQTPSKPSIPKISSKNSSNASESSTGRPSLRKSTSNESPDDLLGEL